MRAGSASESLSSSVSVKPVRDVSGARKPVPEIKGRAPPAEARTTASHGILSFPLIATASARPPRAVLFSDPLQKKLRCESGVESGILWDQKGGCEGKRRIDEREAFKRRFPGKELPVRECFPHQSGFRLGKQHQRTVNPAIRDAEFRVQLPRAGVRRLNESLEPLQIFSEGGVRGALSGPGQKRAVPHAV